MSGRDAAAFYTRYAGLYDRIATDAPFVADVRARVVDTLDPDRGDVVVEMGCGTGANLPYLRERVGRGGTVIGFDVSAGAIDRARTRIDRHGWRNVHVARADATRPPLRVPADGSAVDVSDIDCVLATFLTGMLTDPAGAVDDWLRLVASGEESSRTGKQAGRLCVAGFARSTHPVGRLLNPGFAAGVRLAAPPGSGGDLGRLWRQPRQPGSESAVERLDRRALEAHGRVHERCPDAHTTRLLAGFVRITAGSIESR